MAGNVPATAQVAFQVSFNEYFVRGQHNKVTAKFDNVMLNKGEGYCPMTGIFTAPASGIYVFYMKLQTTPGIDHVFNMFHNERKVGHIYADGGTETYAMVSSMEMVQVNEGDKVWVESGQSLRHQHNKEFRGSDVTRFSGFLLYPN